MNFMMGFDCSGFEKAEIVEFLLNAVVIFWMAPIYASISGGVRIVLGLMIAVLLWFPVTYSGFIICRWAYRKIEDYFS